MQNNFAQDDIEDKFGDPDFYFNHFNAVPIGSLSSKLLKEGEHALFGISPLNGYYSYQRIRLIVKWAARNFKSFSIFYPDTASEHTLSLFGYDEKKIKEKVKCKDNNTTNKIKRALDEIGYSEDQIEKMLIKFSSISNHPKYLELFAVYKNKFDTDEEVKGLCLDLVSGIVKNNNLDITKIDPSKLEYAGYYIVKEVACLLDIPTICNVNSSVFVYNDVTIMYVLERLRMLANLGKANQGYLSLNISSINPMLDQILDCIDVNIYVKSSRDYKYLFANKKMLELGGIDSKGLAIGRDDFECNWKNNALELRKADEHAIQNKDGFYGQEKVGIGDRTTTFITSKKQLLGEDGKIIGVIGSSTNVTEIVEAKEKAEQLAKEKQFFVDILGHEMRNFAFSCANGAKLLIDKWDEMNDTIKKELLGIIFSSANKMSLLSENIFDFSTIFYNKPIPVKKQVIDMLQLLEEDVKLYNMLNDLNGNKIEIKNKNKGESFVISIDRAKISQVVFNLLNNSIKFCKDGVIELDISKTKINGFEYISVAVKDQGIGVDVDNDVFNFKHCLSSDVNRHKGLGIGLPLCKAILESHEGTISIKRNNPIGTVIEFILKVVT